MKRSSLKLKDSIMMPPPKARPKSRSDTSEELRKNLTETYPNSDNIVLHDDFQIPIKEHEELERKNDEELSMSKSTSSINFEKVNPISSSSQNPHSNNSNNLKRNGKTSFNFNLVNYNYTTYTTISDDDENVDSIVSLEKLRSNLIQEGNVNTAYNSNYHYNYNTNNSKSNFKKFSKLPPPSNKKETKAFVDNILKYINEHEFDSSLLVLKIKVQTRDNDYKNSGLKFDYYKESLMKMQNELISRICMYHEEEKKVENGIIYWKILIFLVSFETLRKKRKRNSNDSFGNISAGLGVSTNTSTGNITGNVSGIGNCNMAGNGNMANVVNNSDLSDDMGSVSSESSSFSNRSPNSSLSVKKVSNFNYDIWYMIVIDFVSKKA